MDSETPAPIDPVLGIKVALKSLDNGLFVTIKDGQFAYTEQQDQAMVFDLMGDAVSESIFAIRRDLGHNWMAWPLKAEDAFERCDRCGKLSEVDDIVMLRREFLCPQCLAQAPRD